eukprot:1453058-Rhodomonas_salina.2
MQLPAQTTRPSSSTASGTATSRSRNSSPRRARALSWSIGWLLCSAVSSRRSRSVTRTELMRSGCELDVQGHVRSEQCVPRSESEHMRWSFDGCATA